uniref:acetyl-CoA carboxylase subunit beta n=1 Tax=Ligustrum foliosum TaxID=1354239 RepID=UPI0023AAFD2F|nr:acetyl-CoA carboxylase subunit beta [Ligustrum foliosum]WCO11435.1 acetyl-CoA carboxylase subunit beta [Ligustrum foliosum]
MTSIREGLERYRAYKDTYLLSEEDYFKDEIKGAIGAVIASISDRLESDRQSRIDIDTSDSSDSELKSPFHIDTSDDDDSESPFDFDTFDDDDSELKSPFHIDTSDDDDSESPFDFDTFDDDDSELKSPFHIDTSDDDDSELKAPIEIDTSDSSESDSSDSDSSESDSSDSDSSESDSSESDSSDSDSSESDLQSPIDIDTSIVSDSSDSINGYPSDGNGCPSRRINSYPSDRINRYPSDRINSYPFEIDTSDSSDSDSSDSDSSESDSSDSDSSESDSSDSDSSESDSSDSDSSESYPIDIDTSDDDDSELKAPIEIDTSDSSESDSSDSDSSESYPIDIDTSDSSDSDRQSPIDLDLDAAIASIDEKLERYREATGTYRGDLKDEIRRDTNAVIAGIHARLDKIEEDILNPPIVSDSSDSDSDLDDSEDEGSNDPDPQGTQKFKHLWVLCENETCSNINYKKFLKERLNICEFCGYHLKMSSSDRIELSIDPDTWHPMDEDLFSLDPIEWHSKKHPYKDRIASDQRETGLTEAIQTGRGKLNGIPVAIGVMDFRFVGGSMGSVVGEKITRLIEYATHRLLPLIIVCASGGARMQEGSLSLMQMAKISCALYEYQSNKKLFYVSILASPTTGGVLASFGMLGDIIIAEPNAYIAFAGKRVIEQTLNIIIPEGSQETENLFEKGLFDLIVPRKPLKSVLSELLKFHAFFPWNEKRALLLPLNATLEHN